MFDKLDSSRNEYTDEQTYIKILAKFDFESCKKKALKTPIQQNGLESKFPTRLPFPQTLWKDQFSFETLILVILLLLLSVLSKF